MTGMYLAELNFGVLKYDWDDPRIQDFVGGLDLVNGLASRAPGFVWRLTDDEMDAEQTDAEGALGGNPRMASTLSVWEDVSSLEHFVWNTVHRQFYGRKAEWYDSPGKMVLWWVPVGHRPTVAEGMARWHHRQAQGDSDHAFGWGWLKEAQLFRQRQCAVAAE